MFQTFRSTTQAAGFQEAVAPLPLRVFDPDSGSSRCDDAVPFKVIAQAVFAPGFGPYSGAQVRITPTLGVGRPVTITLGNDPIEWSGVANGVKVEIARLGTSNVVVTGAIVADCPGLNVSLEPVTNRVRSTVLSLAQAAADGAITNPAGFVACQEAARAFVVSAPSLSGGTAMVPVNLTIYGRRTLDGLAVALGSFTVGPVIPGGSAYARIVVPRGLFNFLGYQVVGFPADPQGGTSIFSIWEEVDP